jgi:hypothetical protein
LNFSCGIKLKPARVCESLISVDNAICCSVALRFSYM